MRLHPRRSTVLGPRVALESRARRRSEGLCLSWLEMSFYLQKILVAVAWPYANGPRHIGHVAGFGVPADIFARYHRLRGNDVLMVSGTDEHGTPVMVAADQEGVRRGSSPTGTTRSSARTCATRALVRPVHPDDDAATTTRRAGCLPHALRQGLHRRADDAGAFSAATGRTLPDRYVEGTCPNCGFEARGDQCDNCGNRLDPADLIDPRSKLDGATPASARRRTSSSTCRRSASSSRSGSSAQHALAAERARLLARARRGAEAAPDHARPRLGRAASRSTGYAEDDKRIYVWIDAVDRLPLGARRVGANRGSPDAWRVVAEPGRAPLLLHRQGQHPLPRGHLAGACCSATARGRGRRRQLVGSSCPTTSSTASS